mgnify:CR=1 FL=1
MAAEKIWFRDAVSGDKWPASRRKRLRVYHDTRSHQPTALAPAAVGQQWQSMTAAELAERLENDDSGWYLVLDVENIMFWPTFLLE